MGLPNIGSSLPAFIPQNPPSIKSFNESVGWIYWNPTFVYDLLGTC
jgi:hypothetical protein